MPNTNRCYARNFLCVILGGQYYLYFINTEAEETCYPVQGDTANWWHRWWASQFTSCCFPGEAKVLRPLEWESLQSGLDELGQGQWGLRRGHQGTSLVVQWLGHWVPNAGGLGSIPGQGTWSHMPQLRVCLMQLKIPHATPKTWHSQENK